MKEYELDKSTGEVIFKYDPRIDKPLTELDIDKLNKMLELERMLHDNHMLSSSPKGFKK